MGLKSEQKHLVVSAVNLTEAGPLTVLLESLDVAAQILPAEWKITALVHSRSLIANPRVETLEFPQCKRSWFTRLWFEWFEFGRLSRSLKPDLWLSLHDITPRVQARRQVVYCHNSSPFYQLTWREARLEPSFALFNLFYAQLYRAFISRNQAVVVQQEWLRNAFQRLYAHPNVVVAYPAQQECVQAVQAAVHHTRKPSAFSPLVLLYPALPRVFKNFEVLCEAMKQLTPHIRGLLELRLTISGEENAYARNLHRRFSSVPGVCFIARQTRLQMEEEYRNCDVVLFPSRLETWGLPITEAKSRSKPLLVADLPYAHETVGNCESVTFLPAHDAKSWAKTFESLAAGQWEFGRHSSPVPDEPFAADWSQLWRLLTNGL